MNDSYTEEEFSSITDCCGNYMDEVRGKLVCRSCKLPVEPVEIEKPAVKYTVWRGKKGE